MNEAGISAILTSPPFPAMREAYQSAPLTEEEAYSLVAFLKKADEDQYGQNYRNYQHYFLIAGGLSFSCCWASTPPSGQNAKSKAWIKRYTTDKFIPDFFNNLLQLWVGLKTSYLPKPESGKSFIATAFNTTASVQHTRSKLHRRLLLANSRERRNRSMGDAAVGLSVARK